MRALKFYFEQARASLKNYLTILIVPLISNKVYKITTRAMPSHLYSDYIKSIKHDYKYN